MDRFKLKVLMLIFMLLDHIASFFPGAPQWFHYVGRVVLPIFLYLLVEGYFKTSSRQNYLKRLLVAAEVMFLGDIIISIGTLKGVGNTILSYNEFKGMPYVILAGMIIGGGILVYITLKRKVITDKMACIATALIIMGSFGLNYAFHERVQLLTNNIFLSMVAAFILINGLVGIRVQGRVTVSFIKILVAFSLGILTESLILGPVFAFIFFKCFNNRRDMYLAIIVFSALFFPGASIEKLLAYPQWMMVFSIPLIYFYNGKKGKDLRWLFYIFYPVHLWILFILSSFI